MYLSASFVKYLVFILLIYTAVATLYYFGTKEGRHSKFFSIGALFTTSLIILTSYFFGVYIEKSMYGRKYMGVNRSTFILDEQGTITHVFEKASPQENAHDILKVLK